MKIKVPLNKYLTLKKNKDNSFPFKRQFSVLNFQLRLFFPPTDFSVSVQGTSMTNKLYVL